MSFNLDVSIINHFTKLSKIILEIKHASFSRISEPNSSKWFVTDFKSNNCKFQGSNCYICGNYYNNIKFKTYPKNVRKVILCACNEKIEKEEKVILKNEEIEKEEDNIEKARMRLTKYSEKAFVVYGDTKKHKENLKKLGGKFNVNLRDGPGWIFRNKDSVKVSEWLEKTTIY